MVRVLWIWIISTCWLWNNAAVTSFSIVAITASTATRTTRTTTALLDAAASSNGSRRSFLDAAFMGSIATAIVGASSPLPVFAAAGGDQQLDDLAMPPVVEPLSKDAEAAAMAAKLKRKAELQKQATAPRSFTESFQREMEKEKEFKKKSQDERRDSMCETLGRGC